MKIVSLFGSNNFQFPQNMQLNKNFDKNDLQSMYPVNVCINTEQQQLWKWWMKRHEKLSMLLNKWQLVYTTK